MKPKYMAVLAAGLAGLLGLVLLWRASRTRGETDGNAGSATAVHEPARNGPQSPRPQLPTADQAAGELPSILDLDIDAGARGTRVYVREDGVLVRDHRANASIMDSSSQLVRPKNTASKMAPLTIIAVRNAMRPIVFRCAEAIPATSMGVDPRLQGQVVVSIAEGNLSVDDAVVQVLDVEQSVAEPMRDCVVRGVKDIRFAAPDAADVSRHTLTLPFRLRR